ncbi:Alpha/Beta hydrolase protein [Lasiosphaeria hispida]|uniref:Alpha/Beta hydrolase protein n=1 Tax=Lasiosphaeria hispida TaxID=260671 RepID=A0AAJ0HN90_9PEZI|nr:Alpha/Beta hydrolase protein [Lasiosphaeria hispida]
MSSHQTAKTRYVNTTHGTKFAYRRLGTSSGTPLIVLTHFRGVMDKFDPLLINTLAASRTVVTVDYAGAGLSTGEVASTIKQSADDILEFLGLIGETEVDVLGFSLGGMVAQLVALNADPARVRVRKLILAGTQPSAGEGIVESPNTDVGTWAGVQNVTVEGFQTLFFPKSREGAAANLQWWDRLNERSVATSGEEPATWLSEGYLDGGKGLQAQGGQIGSWASPEASEGLEGSFARLATLKIPVFVANGHDDYMVPTVNSFVLQQKVPNGQLIVYPNSGHGFLFQYVALFAQHTLLFLEA